MAKKHVFTPSVSFSQGPNISALRDLAKNEPENFMRKVDKLVNSGDISLQKIKNLRALYSALADVPVNVQMPDAAGNVRAMTASAFPVLTGTTVVAAINAAYESVPTIGEQLVTEMEDNNKVTTVASLHSLDKDIEEVKEMEDFPEIGADEESVEIRHRKNGRILKISAEMVSENQVSRILDRVNALGEIASDWIEEQTLKRVYDYDGSAASDTEPYAYRPNGTGTSLYSASANTPGTRAPNGTRYNSNTLNDYTDIENARGYLASMKNNRGTRIGLPWSEVILLVPDALVGVASRIANSELIPGVENEINSYGPRGMWPLAGKVLSSPKCDDLSTTCWHLGRFKRQFVRKWKLRFEYVTLGTNTQAYLQKQVVFQARIAWDVEVGARDYVYVIQNLTSTDAPKDE